MKGKTWSQFNVVLCLFYWLYWQRQAAKVLKTSFSDFTTLFFSFTAAAVVVDVTMHLLVLTVTLQYDCMTAQCAPIYISAITYIVNSRSSSSAGIISVIQNLEYNEYNDTAALRWCVCVCVWVSIFTCIFLLLFIYFFVGGEPEFIICSTRNTLILF